LLEIYSFSKQISFLLPSLSIHTILFPFLLLPEHNNQFFLFSEPIFGSLVAITAKFYAKNLHFSIDLSSGCLQFWGKNKNMDFYEFR